MEIAERKKTGRWAWELAVVWNWRKCSSSWRAAVGKQLTFPGTPLTPCEYNSVSMCAASMRCAAHPQPLREPASMSSGFADEGRSIPATQPFSMAQQGAQSRNPLLCFVCNDFYAEPCLLGCFHSFCSRCLQGKDSEGKFQCPLCGWANKSSIHTSCSPVDLFTFPEHFLCFVQIYLTYYTRHFFWVPFCF